MATKIIPIAFQSGKIKGVVKVYYSVNKGIKDSGFTAIGRDFTDEMVKGFPVLRATITFGGKGYEAMFGWIQIVSHIHRNGLEKHFTIDLARSMEGNDFPYCQVGYKDTFFDAPCNRPRTSMTWRAYTFLFPFVSQPNREGGRRFYPLAGFTWGYVLSNRGRTVEVLDVKRITANEWKRLFPKCLPHRFPAWYRLAKRESDIKG